MVRALFAMLFWAASFVFVKIVYQYLGPISTIFIRLIISGSLLMLFYALNKNREKIYKKDFLLLFLLGFTEPFLYFIGEGFGMKYITATHASVIVATIPIFAMISSALLYKEKVSVINKLGVIVSFLGIILMIGIKGLLAPGSAIGFALMFFAVFAAVSNSLLIFKLGNRYSSLTIITVQNVVGALLFLPLFFIFEPKGFSFTTFNFELIGSIIFLSIFPSVISFVLFISVLKEIGITKASAFTNLIPVLTGIISFILLGTRFSIIEILGIGFVIVGLFLSQKRNYEEIIPYKG